jgi:hypothetical protein
VRLYENISLTKRATVELNKYAGFSLTNLADGEKSIVLLQWIVLSRRGVGEEIYYRGPHFKVREIPVGKLNEIKNICLFRVEDKYICLIISLDLGFSEDVHYKLDFVDEFYLYPAEMDNWTASPSISPEGTTDASGR